MDKRELVALFEKGFADLHAKVNERIDGEFKALRTEIAKKPVTENGKGLTEVGAKGPNVEGGAPLYEQMDSYKGKGVMLARAARCLAAADRARKSPIEVAKDWKIPDGYMARLLDGEAVEKALGESTLGSGGVFTPDQFSMEFIDLLRAKVVLTQQAITRLPMSSQTITISRQSGAATATWIGESQNSTKSEQTFDDIQLKLRKLACLTPVSNDLLRDNVIAADIIVRNDLLAIAVREMDLKAMRGLGTQHSPKGVLSLTNASNKFNSQAAGNPTLTSQLYDSNNAVRLVKEGNVLFDKSNAIWIMSPRTESGYRQTRDGVGRPFWAEEMDERGTLLGYKYFTTTAVPNNLTGNGSGGSAESELYFIVLPEFYLGEGLAPTIEVERNAAYYDGSAVQSGMSRDETAIKVVLRVDFQMRHDVAASIVQGVVDT